MTRAARVAGKYQNEFIDDRHYDKIKIVTIEGILDKTARLDVPLTRSPLRSAQPQLKEVQLELG